MAAGIGSRFGTGIKQLEPVDDAGHIIMDYSIHDAIEAGFNHVVWRKKLTTECIENVIMMMPFSAVVMWSFEEMIGNRWKKILWQSGKIAFIFSVSIEMLQLLLRLGTFQRSDIFYNTVGGVLGGLMYCAVVKARKRL